MPAKVPRPVSSREANRMIQVGTKVFLHGSPHGEPGTVIRMERGRAVVLWSDLDFIARHRPASLCEVGDNISAGCREIQDREG
jgi:hypothetical protein